MARFIPDVPEDKRYSKNEVEKIRDKIYEIIISDELKKVRHNILNIADTLQKELCEIVKKLQDPEIQKLINDVKQNGKITYTPALKEDWLTELEEQADGTNKFYQNVKYLININIIDKEGNVNEKLDLNYINSVDYDKLDGYRKHLVSEHERKVQEFQRRNRLSAEDLHRPFTI